ncbi:hypothetical protein BGZ80_006819, partial [Entomortierella chlamydospora]
NLSIAVHNGSQPFGKLVDDRALGATVQLSKSVEGSYILNSEKAGIDSASPRNFKEHVRNIIPHKITKKVGTKADLIW